MDIKYTATKNLMSIELEGNPPNLFGLVTTDHLDSRLERGAALLAFFAAWSVPDVQIAPLCFELAGNFPSLSIGMMLFNEHEEITRVLPSIRERAQSPVWAWLVDGNLVRVDVGTFLGSPRQGLNSTAEAFLAGLHRIREAEA